MRETICLKMTQCVISRDIGAATQSLVAGDSELSADLQKRHHGRQNDAQRYVSYRLRSKNQKSTGAEIKVPHNYAKGE